MRIKAVTRGEPVTIMVEVETRTPEKIWLVVRDNSKPKTIFTKRYAIVKGKQKFFVRMPLSPKVAMVQVFNADTGDRPMGRDRSFRVTDITKLPLKTNYESFDTANSEISRFVKFAEEFSLKASYLSAKGSVYTSDDGKFRIDYYDMIKDRSTGAIVKTPARISKKTGVIEIAKKKFDKMSVPMRMAILLHEFSHFYLNKVMSDETEADLNALRIYLGLGYPRIDAYNVFLKVFETSPTQQNVERYEELANFIKDFEYKYNGGTKHQ